MSTLAKIAFGWTAKFTLTEQLKLKSLAFDAPFEPTDSDKELYSEIIMLVEDAASFGKEFTVKQVLPAGIVDRLFHGQRETTIVNEKCHVAVAGLGLLTVDTVIVRENYCTEALQNDLKEGWRIIAICVQPDQRRPDYILGRTNGTIQ